ncbi:MAG: FHA domain-containing protein [Chloroflexota bacterium]
MIVCPECNTEHYGGALFCQACGAALVPATQAHMVARQQKPGQSGSGGRRISDPSQSVPRPTDTGTLTPEDSSRKLQFTIPHRERTITVTLDDTIHIGRADPDAGFTPEIDLSPFDGFDKGVSRRHATIQLFREGIVVIDQYSSNGTRLEDRPLTPGQAYILPPKAALRFGELLVHLTIED